MAYNKRRHTAALRAVSLLIGAVVLLCVLKSITHAQGSITADGTMGTVVQFNGTDHNISQGTIVGGSNQFHSFGSFNVNVGESATFTGPGTVENIIGRVTGGTQSMIDGLIRSDISGANLFLLNPSGVFFGPNANMDMTGSFHVSTADYLQLGDGEGVFYADLTMGDTLTVGSPLAFGFLNGNPEGITINQGLLQVLEDETISIVGGDLTMVGDGDDTTFEISAPSGRVNIASVASAGEVILNAAGETPDLQVDSFETLGTIDVSQEMNINAGGNAGGTVIIRSGRFVVSSASVYASTQGDLVTGEPGTGLDVKVTGDVVLNDGAMGTNVFSGISDDSGGVRIESESLEMSNFSQIQSVAYSSSFGNSGSVEINTDNLLVEGGSMIRVGVGGSGDSGDIVVTSRRMEIRDAGILFSPAFDGSGNSGDIDVTADSILMSNLNFPGYPTGMQTSTEYPATGNAGDIRVTANSLKMSAGTAIQTPSYFVGEGGDITVSVNGDVSIEGTRDTDPWGYTIYTGILANTFGYAKGGDLNLTADSLKMSTKASLECGSVYPYWFSYPPSYTGNAGNMTLTVGSLELTDAAYISSSGYFGLGGNAGTVEVIADSINISGPESSSDPWGADSTGISTASSPYYGGLGGDIHISAADSLIVTNRSTITASSGGDGAGGNIVIDNTGSVQVLNGANIQSGAKSTGDGGSVDINADSVLISGVHPEVFVNDYGEEQLSPSAISSLAETSGGNAGDVMITSGSLDILDGGQLTGGTYGTGNGGNIFVEADSVFISGMNSDLRDNYIAAGGNPKWAGSSIRVNSAEGLLGDLATGDSGYIKVTAGNVRVQDKGLISSETTTPGAGGNIDMMVDSIMLLSNASVSCASRVSAIAGNAGDISITASNTFHSGNSSVNTAAEQGAGGDITITADQVTLANGSMVTAESSGDGNAGNIHVKAWDIFLSGGSAFNTQATQSDGGNIEIVANYMLRLEDSSITSSVNGGPTTVGGNIDIDPVFVLMQNSAILANAFEGTGGNISLVADVFLADPGSLVDASSALGIDGEVDIQAPIRVTSGMLEPLKKDFKSAAELLRKPCMARIQGGKYSSFVVASGDGMPLEPGGLIQSPLFLE